MKINKIKNPVIIRKVLYVPGMGTNLFSIAAVTDLGWKVAFTGTRVHFTSENGSPIMVGERVGRTLYLLDVKPRPHLERQQSFACASSLSPGLATWHRRFAHISPKTIIKMAASGVVKGLDLASREMPRLPIRKAPTVPFPHWPQEGNLLQPAYPLGHLRPNGEGYPWRSALFCALR